ncbi:hypothetical protein PQR14_36120 [Paraburkholderia bryophila]|jgi:hypothetical protein|uniref:hypothetical protein n=1 Tax=Paraburkholderia bryophila TaxID=420952 RepID=UPI0038BCA63A
MNKPLMEIPGLHSFAADSRDDATGIAHAHRSRVYELDKHFENWHSLITGNQAKHIRKSAREGQALNPDDLDHFSDDARHLELVSDLLKWDAIACHDEAMFMAAAEKCILHAGHRSNPILARKLYNWLRSLGYSTMQISMGANLCVHCDEADSVFRKLELSRLCEAVIK